MTARRSWRGVLYPRGRRLGVTLRARAPTSPSVAPRYAPEIAIFFARRRRGSSIRSGRCPLGSNSARLVAPKAKIDAAEKTDRGVGNESRGPTRSLSRRTRRVTVTDGLTDVQSFSKVGPLREERGKGEPGRN